MDLLDSMIRKGLPLLVQSSLLFNGIRSSLLGPFFLLCCMILMLFGVLALVLFIILLVVFTIGSVTPSMGLSYIVGVRLFRCGGRISWFTRTSGFGLIWCPLLLSCSVSLVFLLVVLEFGLILLGLTEKFRKAWLPNFCRSGQRDAGLEEFDEEVEGQLPLLPENSLPQLTGQMLADVGRRIGATAVGLEGVEGLLDAYIAMIPKFDGDAAPLGQRPLSVLPVMYRIWASARMVQLEDWFWSQVPDSVKKVLVVVAGRLRLETTLFWMLRRCFLVLLTLMFISSWLMLSSCPTPVDRGFFGLGLVQSWLTWLVPSC